MPTSSRLGAGMAGALMSFVLTTTADAANQATVEAFVNAEGGGLSTARSTARLNVLQSDDTILDLQAVQLPQALHTRTALRFTIDPRTESIHTGDAGNRGTTVTAERTGMTLHPDGSLAWTADLHLDGESVGHMILLESESGEITGSVDIGERFYQIRPLGNGIQALAEVDWETRGRRASRAGRRNFHRAHPTDGSEGITSRPQTRDFEPAIDATATGGERCATDFIRLLVLYTPNAADGRDIPSLVNLAVQENNQAYDNSQMTGQRVVVNHIQQWEFVERHDIRQDRDRLMADSDVAALREQHQADVVLLITDGPYGSTIGIAGDIAASQSDGYGIVQADNAAGPDYTLAHEIHHLHGAQHHPNDPVRINPPFQNAYGHRYKFRKNWWNLHESKRSTIMAYTFVSGNNDTYKRILHFSNPDVKKHGERTGRPDRDNTTAIEPRFPVMADWYDPNEFRSDMYAYGDGEVYGLYHFNSTACGGAGDYDYEWRLRKSSESFPGSPTATGQSFNQVLDINTSYEVELTVRDGVDRIREHRQSFHVSGPNPGPDPCPPGEMCWDPESTGAKEIERLPGADRNRLMELGGGE